MTVKTISLASVRRLIAHWRYSYGLQWAVLTDGRALGWGAKRRARRA